MRSKQALWKTAKIGLLLFTAAAVVFLVRHCFGVYLTPIEWNCRARLILDDGTEYPQVVPVRIKAGFYRYTVHAGIRSDYLNLTASVRDKELFDGSVVYCFNDWQWQWAAQDRTEQGFGHIDRQAVFTDFGTNKKNPAFVFCIDDVSKITDGGAPGRRGLLIAPKWNTDRTEDIVQSLAADPDTGAAGFLKDYGLSARIWESRRTNTVIPAIAGSHALP